jgi:hypothetical protein
LKVVDSKKRSRLQDREDVAMEEENGSSTSQECGTEEEVPIQEKQTEMLTEGDENQSDRRLIKGKRAK